MAGWAELRAVREGRVYLADGNQYFNRPGPRVAEALEIMAGRSVVRDHLSKLFPFVPQPQLESFLSHPKFGETASKALADGTWYCRLVSEFSLEKKYYHLFFLFGIYKKLF